MSGKVFTNGKIYVNSDTVVDSLYVVDGKVAGYKAVPGCEIVDLEGATVYPGFIDSHVHIVESGYFFQVGINMYGCNTAEAIAVKIEEKIKQGCNDELILGFGFGAEDYDKWSVKDLARIDEASAGRKILLFDRLGHNSIVNTASMEYIKVTVDTKVPRGGKMVSENGCLTGMMRESAMIFVFDNLSKLFSREDLKECIRRFAEHWAETGYTGIVELMGAPGMRMMYPDLFRELEQEGKMPLRVNFCYTIFNGDDIEKALEYRGHDTDLVRFLGLKVFVDGAYAAGEAWTTWEHTNGGYGLQEIYTDDDGGESLNIYRIIDKAEQYKLNVHYHAQGDQAIKVVLDGLDMVMAKKGRIDGVHTLIHMAFITDELIERIKRFGGKVVSTMQPGFWQIEEGMEYFYGDWQNSAYPVKKIIDSGVSVGLSTDFAVSPPEYSPSMIVAKSAMTGGGEPELHIPLSVKDVVKGFTEGSAATTGFKDIGKLDIGCYADMLVYEKDISGIPPVELSINNPRLLSSWLGGKQVYRCK